MGDRYPDWSAQPGSGRPTDDDDTGRTRPYPHSWTSGQPAGNEEPYGPAASAHYPPAPAAPPSQQPPPQQPPTPDQSHWYGYGYAQGQPVYVPTGGTNGFAIASLVLGILWIYWLGSILAVIFGHVALKQIKRNHEGGRGLAVAGLVLGYIGIAVMVAGAVVAAIAGIMEATSP